MKIKLIYLLFCAFLLSSSINQEEINRINQFNYYLESASVSLSVKDINLFNTKNDAFEFQNFEAPIKITSTTLNPLSREMSLYESALIYLFSVVVICYNSVR
jgi:hypothetical protein